MIVLSPINDACVFCLFVVCLLLFCFCFVFWGFGLFFFNVTLAYEGEVKLRSHYKKTHMIHRTENYHRPLRRSVDVHLLAANECPKDSRV